MIDENKQIKQINEVLAAIKKYEIEGIPFKLLVWWDEVDGYYQYQIVTVPRSCKE